MDSRSSRRARSTGPSRPGSGTRAGRPGAIRSGRTGIVRPATEPAAEPETTEPLSDTVADAVEEAPAVAPGSRGRRARRSTSGPASTRPGTAPTAAATVAARRIRRITARGTDAPKVRRSRSQLVRQVVVLALVFSAVAFAVAVPLRNYLTQRTELAATVSQEQLLRDQLAALQAQQTAMSDPAYVVSEAKRRLQYVKPGDTIYVVHAPPLAAKKVAAAPKVEPTTPWYSSLWDTLSDPTVTAKPAIPSQGSAPVPTNTVKTATANTPAPKAAPTSGTGR